VTGGGSSTDAFVTQAATAYAYVFFGVLLALSVCEWVLPRRPAGAMLGTRWAGNIALAVLDSLVLRLLVPLSGVAWAAVGATHGWGILHGTHLPIWAACLVSLAVLDFMSYFQHYLLHRVPLLWRIHVPHHTDHEVDVTTGFRFHPIESLYTMLVRYTAIAVVGLPPVGVLGAELASTVWAFLDHANVRVPHWLERGLRLVVVTPDVHRTHHSRDGRDNRTNLGAVLTVWDRLFRTFREEPAAGRGRAVMGLPGFESRHHVTLPWMLAQPFLGGDGRWTRSRSPRDADSPWPPAPVG
jgi:sterol desaturase/sphingolipid hydroxylase (fatty acid hydroxylase superfamily)